MTDSDLNVRFRMALYRSRFENLVLFAQFEDLRLFITTQRENFIAHVVEWQRLNGEIFEINVQDLCDSITDCGAKGASLLGKVVQFIKHVTSMTDVEALFPAATIVEGTVIMDAMDDGTEVAKQATSWK